MKVALIGASGHQGYAVCGARADSEAQIVAAADTPDAGSVSSLFPADGSTGTPKIYGDYREMLDAEQPDVVSVSPVHCEHQPISVECLKRGIHVYCEKPVALDLESLRELRNVCRKSGCHFAGMHAFRYEPNFRAGYEALKRGDIGRPLLITGQKSYPFNRNYPGPCNRPDFYRERTRYGGTLPWVAIHAIDWTCWMMGGISEVYALNNRDGHNWGECEMSGVIAFKLDSGAHGAINFDFLNACKNPVPQDRCRIAGENGVIEIHSGKAEIATHDAPPRDLDNFDTSTACMFADFLKQVRGTGKCLLSAEDTFEVTRLALLARESADTGHPVRTADFLL